MRKLHYFLVDVFTDRAFGGNPLAVFTDGKGVPGEIMQSIAKEFNLSETTFVLPPEDVGNNYRVRIFTPTVELPFAGHPTIGTTYILARERMVEKSPSGPTTVRLEEGVGTIPVRIEWKDGTPAFIEMSQPLPAFGLRFEDVETIAQVLSLEAEAITAPGLPMEVVSCGVPFLFVALRDLEAVRSIRLRLDVWERVLKNSKAANVFVFTKETEVEGSTVHSRMFAPASGILEDPATGGASGPLGSYLVRHKVFPGRLEFVSEQGLEMGRPSFIKIRIEQDAEGQISGVHVGGQCHFMGSGHLEIDC